MKEYLEESYDKYFQIKEDIESIIDKYVFKNNKDMKLNHYIDLVCLAIQSCKFNEEVNELLMLSLREAQAYCHRMRGYEIEEWSCEKQDAYHEQAKHMAKQFNIDLNMWL